MSVVNYRCGVWCRCCDYHFAPIEIRRKAKRKDERSWRSEVQNELWEMENEKMTGYLILNEVTFRGTDQIATEPVSLHASLAGAMEWLHDVARESGVEVEPDSDSVYVPPMSEYVESDEYYIIEMEMND